MMTLNSPNNQTHESIGYIVGGSLKDSFRVRLTVPPQDVQEGSFVVIESGGWLFYGLVTDLQLGSTDPRFADEQTEERLPAGVAKLLHGQTLYTTLEVMPAYGQTAYRIDILARSGIDGFVITTGTHTHADLLKAAIAAGADGLGHDPGARAGRRRLRQPYRPPPEPHCHDG